MPDAEGETTLDRARLEVLRRCLGAHLAACRAAAGVAQPELGRALGRTRSMVSRVEHGARGMPAALWKIADEVCGADGALIAEYGALEQAERDYRDQRRAARRQARQADAQAQLAALTDSVMEFTPWPEGALTSGTNGELAKELRNMIVKLIRSMGRRDAMRTASWALAAAGLSGLDPEERTRLARAVAAPRRMDAQVVHNVAVTLSSCRRQEDALGPGDVLGTLVAQHEIVHHLLAGGCPEQLRRALSRVDSAVAATLGNCLVNLGHSEEAQRYLGHARRAGHDARDAACAAYAAALASFAAFERGDTPAALDAAAAARSLAARTDDAQLKALAEQEAAAAYALDGQHGPYMAACSRAHGFLSSSDGVCPDSPAYWLNHGRLTTKASRLLGLLGRHEEALDAASTALAGSDPASFRYPLCQVRLGHALVLSQDITEAARVLGEAAQREYLSPRLIAEFRATRGLLQPWAHTPAVATLDDHLRTWGLRA